MRAHAFVVRDERILVLEQANGARWWEAPGGTVEPGESPDETVVREVFEETGLRIEAPELLRRWWHENRRGDVVDCHTYVASGAQGEVDLSEEHTAFDWITVERYADQYCGAELFANGPAWLRAFMAEVREDCALFGAWLTSGARTQA